MSFYRTAHTQMTGPQLFTSSINIFLCPMLPENRTFPEPDENFSDGTMYFFGYLVQVDYHDQKKTRALEMCIRT